MSQKARRRADSFGLVYVAATFARECGALPVARQFTNAYYGKAIKECYQLHLGSVAPPVPLADGLMELANDPRCLDTGLSEKPTREEIRNAPMILLRVPRGNELLVMPNFINDAFPGWKARGRGDELYEALSRDTDHLGKKRVVLGEELGRVHVFPMPRDDGNRGSIFEA